MSDIRIEDQLADREALRRVPGLSTNSRTSARSSIAKFGWSGWCSSGCGPRAPPTDADRSLHELAHWPRRPGQWSSRASCSGDTSPDPATYIGSGKARELRDIVVATGADTVICDGELTPGQLRKLEEVVKVKVVDRTWLILDIFAQHATSREGKAQVALAQMEYMLPRLRGWGESLSRRRVAARVARRRCRNPRSR